MANVVKKYSISSELAQKMVNAAVAKAREIGVAPGFAHLAKPVLDELIEAAQFWIGPDLYAEVLKAFA